MNSIDALLAEHAMTASQDHESTDIRMVVDIVNVHEDDVTISFMGANFHVRRSAIKSITTFPGIPGSSRANYRCVLILEPDADLSQTTHWTASSLVRPLPFALGRQPNGPKDPGSIMPDYRTLTLTHALGLIKPVEDVE